MNQEKVAEVQDESVTKDNNIITVNLPTKVRRFTFSYATKESCPIIVDVLVDSVPPPPVKLTKSVYIQTSDSETESKDEAETVDLIARIIASMKVPQESAVQRSSP
ncbi:hypothetical protein PAXINDRAFT_14464 [Paxillus involutus ATCC 200175]|uniref:Uncharacterized protein n=1 Tax=Paxillus involutus ATCC 200175 TaxID=664439 RepID=A0A0C9TQH0_PAXIN|nr:hypothetical protein PAXINDRAFT_14464 [Paxillus involutus ATCC 200175]